MNYTRFSRRSIWLLTIFLLPASYAAAQKNTDFCENNNYSYNDQVSFKELRESKRRGGRRAQRGR